MILVYIFFYYRSKVFIYTTLSISLLQSFPNLTDITLITEPSIYLFPFIPCHGVTYIGFFFKNAKLTKQQFCLQTCIYTPRPHCSHIRELFITKKKSISKDFSWSFCFSQFSLLSRLGQSFICQLPTTISTETSDKGLSHLYKTVALSLASLIAVNKLFFRFIYFHSTNIA